MATTQTVTHLGLCAGYGGIELGLKRVLPTLRSVALCEIEAFPIANLVAKMEAGLMDAAPIWTDLKTFPWESFRDRVDILTGGYPCQPFSAAGKRAGKEDPRHLWPWIADGIRILRPRVCFFENVEGHISLGLSSVISDLEELGYQVSWGIFSAREVGAPHQRKRVFILANREGEHGWRLPVGEKEEHSELGGGCDNELAHSADERHEWSSIIRSPSASEAVERCGAWSWPSRPGEPQHGWEPPRVVANSKRSRGEEPEHLNANLPTEPSRGDTEVLGNCDSLDRSASPEGWEHDSEAGSASERQAQSALGGNPDGPADWLDYAELYTTCDNRTDELRLLGNGVVPATAERAFRTLLTELLTNKTSI